MVLLYPEMGSTNITEVGAVSVAGPSAFNWVEFVYDGVIEEELQLGEAAAFFAYERLVPRVLVDQNERDPHHGIPHLARVMIHSRLSQLHSAEFSQVEDEMDDRALLFSKATTLTERFHDLIQQNLNRLGFHKESKTLHAEIGALYLMLFSPELIKEGYSIEDIYFAAFMTFFHSEPERIRGGEFLSFSELYHWLEEQVEKKIAHNDFSHNTNADGTQKLTTLLDFIPMPPGSHITHETLLKRLNDPNFFVAPTLDEKMKELLLFFAERFAIADKMDALTPPEQANYRTEQVFVQRPLYVTIDKQTAESIFMKNLDDIEQKLLMKPNERLQQQKAELESLRDEVNTAFGQSDVLPVDLEYRFRLLAGSLISEDDLSRVLFESTRNYDLLSPTQYERLKIGQSLHTRLAHFLQIIEHSAGKVHNQDVAKAHTDAKLDKTLSLTGVELARIQQLIMLAQRDVSKLYDNVAHHEIIHPLGGKDYSPQQPTIEMAEIMYHYRTRNARVKRLREYIH